MCEIFFSREDFYLAAGGGEAKIEQWNLILNIKASREVIVFVCKTGRVCTEGGLKGVKSPPSYPDAGAASHLVLGVSAGPPPDHHHADQHGHHQGHPGEGDGHVDIPLLPHLDPPD